MAPPYRALISQNGVYQGAPDLHLNCEDAEASLCGIPRSSLAEGRRYDDLVCDDCLSWFERRRRASGPQVKV